jgi:hypothetical protein
MDIGFRDPDNRFSIKSKKGAALFNKKGGKKERCRMDYSLTKFMH